MASVFLAGDLLFTDYKWTAYPSDDPHVTGKPDSTLLNRSEGYEMVYFIDRYMKSKGWTSKGTGQKIEKYLRSSKSGSQSHASWIKELDKNLSI